MALTLDGKLSVRQTAGERGNGSKSLRGAALKGANIVGEVKRVCAEGKISSNFALNDPELGWGVPIQDYSLSPHMMTYIGKEVKRTELVSIKQITETRLSLYNT